MIQWQNRSRLFNAFEAIIQEPLIVEKQTILHLKALIMDIKIPEDEGLGVIKGLPCTQFVKRVIFSGKKGVASP